MEFFHAMDIAGWYINHTILFLWHGTWKIFLVYFIINMIWLFYKMVINPEKPAPKDNQRLFKRDSNS